MSTFSGIVNEIPNISVDRFDGINLRSTAYFLSHCHSDHMHGLNNREFFNRLEENNIYLYCSELSYNILLNTNVKNVKDFIRVLSYQMEVIVEVPATESYQKSQNITVTVIPAGHCPGSVMFMFDCGGGRVLYTGDIRLLEGDVRKMKQFLNCDGSVKPIKTLYLDTTFLHADYSYFPPRAASAEALCLLIAEWITQNPEHYVHIVTPAKHGSEFLFAEIYKKLKIKVHVSLEHFELYRNVPEIETAITASSGLTQIHACWELGKPCSFLREKKERGMVRSIKPSAIWFRKQQAGNTLWQKNRNGRFSVAYSCHSSLDELIDIINFLEPNKIEPCVIPPNGKKEDVTEILRSIQKRNGKNKHKLFSDKDERDVANNEFKRLLSQSIPSKNCSERVKVDLPSPPRKSTRFK